MKAGGVAFYGGLSIPTQLLTVKICQGLFMKISQLILAYRPTNKFSFIIDRKHYNIVSQKISSWHSDQEDRVTLIYRG